MQLKRQTSASQKEGGTSSALIDQERKPGITFITTGGLSIDFPASQHDYYLAATENNCIHFCSVSYSEQYINTFHGHQGPVYRVRCSPFWQQHNCEVFITCSYDWTV